jgi:preprotein translocase subunit SecE
LISEGKNLEKIEKATQFLKEVKQELKKVVWPTKKQTIASTSVVLVVIFFIGFFLGLIDLGLGWVLKTFLR